MGKRPLLTTCCTSASIVCAGDIFAQLVIEGGEFNARRAANMILLGAGLIGPTLFNWYRFLNRFIPDPSTLGAVKRLALDQGLFAPPFIAVFFSSVFALEGRLDQLPAHLKQAFWPACVINWQLWIPAMFITFRFIPPRYQVLWVQSVALIWNSYLSWSGHRAHLEEEQKKKAKAVTSH